MGKKQLKCYDIFRNGTQQGTINAYTKKEAINELSSQFGKDCCNVEFSHNVTFDYEIRITFSEFGKLSKVYKKFAKDNRKVIIEIIEYEDTEEQHNSGLLIDTIKCIDNSIGTLRKMVSKYISDNSLHQECFGIYDKNDLNKELYTENTLFED
jgi:hypothetical protein